jgi:hypothetical protein
LKKIICKEFKKNVIIKTLHLNKLNSLKYYSNLIGVSWNTLRTGLEAQYKLNAFYTDEISRRWEIAGVRGGNDKVAARCRIRSWWVCFWCYTRGYTSWRAESSLANLAAATAATTRALSLSRRVRSFPNKQVNTF